MNGTDLLCAIAEADADFIREASQFSAIRAAIRAKRKKQRILLAAGGVTVLCLAAPGISKSVVGLRSPVSGASVDAPAQSRLAVLPEAETAGVLSSPESITSAGISLSEWCSRTDVVWGTQEEKGSENAEAVLPGTAKISDPLFRLMDGKPQDTIYAVTVDFSSGITDAELDQRSGGGKTVAELKSELQKLTKSSDPSRSYLITDSEGNQTVGFLPPAENEEKISGISGEINAIRRAFIEEKFRSYQESFRQQGLEIYADTEEYRTDQMIFYTFATRTQLENFSCKASEAFIFLPTCELK